MRLLMERYLQGKVAFTSTVESGTTFTAYCPLTIGSAAKTPDLAD
jgi:hypothetical protein